MSRIESNVHLVVYEYIKIGKGKFRKEYTFTQSKKGLELTNFKLSRYCRIQSVAHARYRGYSTIMFIRAGTDGEDWYWNCLSELKNAKSFKELAKINKLKDIPIPDKVRKAAENKLRLCANSIMHGEAKLKVSNV